VVTIADMRAAISCAAPASVEAALAASPPSTYALSTAELVVLASLALLVRDAPQAPAASAVALSTVLAKAATVAPLAVKGAQVLTDMAAAAAAFGLASRGLLAIVPRPGGGRLVGGGTPDCALLLTPPVATVSAGLRAGPLARLFVNT